MELFHGIDVDWLGKKWYFLAFSLIFSVSGILSILFWHHINLGVDFRGGTLVYVQFAQPPNIDAIRQATDRASGLSSGDYSSGLSRAYGCGLSGADDSGGRLSTADGAPDLYYSHGCRLPAADDSGGLSRSNASYRLSHRDREWAGVPGALGRLSNPRLFDGWRSLPAGESGRLRDRGVRGPIPGRCFPIVRLSNPYD